MVAFVADAGDVSPVDYYAWSCVLFIGTQATLAFNIDLHVYCNYARILPGVMVPPLTPADSV